MERQGEWIANAAAGSPLAGRALGSNQLDMRQFNERVVLHAIRLRGALPKAELARVTRLSTQAVSGIVDGLLEEGLLMRQGRVRGRLGQPSIPFALDPDGAFGLGVHLGRRRLDVLAVDFAGQVRAWETLDVAAGLAALRERLAAVRSAVGPRPQRLLGVGVAGPRGGAPPGGPEGLAPDELGARLQGLLELPVEVARDATAGCAAELLLGRGREARDFLYLFVGPTLGAGLVLDGRLHAGARGNAGALDALPLGWPGGPPQLARRGSGLALERALAGEGLPPGAAYDARALDRRVARPTRRWLEDAGAALALAIASAAATVDLGLAVVDGALHPRLLAEAVARAERALGRHAWEGISRPRVVVGTAGPDAPALGAALLPVYRRFAPVHG